MKSPGTTEQRTAPRQKRVDEGSTLVMVLIIMMSFVALSATLLFLSLNEHVVAINEQDHVKALSFAEAGLTWAERRVVDANDLTDLLRGPDTTASTGDDSLLGLRDLSLTNASQFNTTNESTKSAIVSRDFGDGAKSWELIRIADTARTRALVYVRIDDNFDDDPDDPNNNDPLDDTDVILMATAIAEYPIFVDGSGAEVPNGNDKRGRAVTRLEMVLRGPAPSAIVADGDVGISGGDMCGACGSVHANNNLNITSGSPAICQNATATGSASIHGSAAVGGLQGGGFPSVPIPIINPYDPLFVPLPGVFDTSALALPGELQCGPPTGADPGNAKYFAFVSNNDNGLVFKAYWDSTNSWWEWTMIDDLNDGVEVMLDECGRAPGDPSYGAGVADGGLGEFYGFNQFSKEDTDPCTACGNPGDDESLCTIGNNDFSQNIYYDAATGTPVIFVAGSGVTALPGGFTQDGAPDFNPDVRHKKSQWKFSSNSVYSPIYNAVIFVYGNWATNSQVGGGNGKYCNSLGCGGSGSLPNNSWAISVISTGNIELSGNPSYGPANPTAGYSFLFIAGRDVTLTGVAGGSNVCGSGCATGAPPGADTISGIIAAHEQISLGGNAQVRGFMVAEDAATCEPLVNGDAMQMNGGKLFYDCNNPPNPWKAPVEPVSWQERN